MTNNKQILINATNPDELRIGIVEIVKNQNYLVDLILDVEGHKTKVGNIYAGEVASIAPSLNAAFIKYTNGNERHGFLPLKDIAPEYFTHHEVKKGDQRLSIENVLKEGQKIMVQVEKEERGNKGAALTTFISLAGSYLVLMPNNPRAGGISRRVESEDREDLRETLSTLSVPEGMGRILRTAGVGKSAAELAWDLNILLSLWEAIKKAYTEREAPLLIHQESNIVIRTIRDYLKDEMSLILIDNSELFANVKSYLEQIRPDFLDRLQLYESNVPLFSFSQVENQIEAAHQRKLELPSGGVIIIDYTEALVAIDVNSARATKGRDIDETALSTNLEAADMIARYLRICDIGGLIVIDFIDMLPAHRTSVEQRLRDALKLDKARTQIGSISSRFGILQMSRQRLRRSLGETTRVVCPRCDGWGSIRSVESLTMSILRMIEEEAVKPNTAQIQIQLPINVATFIINEKRETLSTLEEKHKVKITIVPNPELESPLYRIKRISENESNKDAKGGAASYRLLKPTNSDDTVGYKKSQSEKAEEKPAVKNTFLTGQASPSTRKQPASIVKRFLTSLFGSSSEEEQEEKIAPAIDAPAAKTQYPASQSAPGKHQRNAYKSSEKNHSPRNNTPKNRDHKFKPTEPNTPHSPIVPPHAQNEHEKTDADLKSRTRRGTRGGRRRVISPMQHSAQTPIYKARPPTTTTPTKPIVTGNEQTSPDHLPPFPTDPTDLEDYYQTSVKSSKRLYRTPSTPKQEKPASGTTENTEAQNKASELPPTSTGENKAPAIPSAPEQVPEKPVVVRFEAKKEKE